MGVVACRDGTCECGSGKFGGRASYYLAAAVFLMCLLRKKETFGAQWKTETDGEKNKL
jgi:hypothetical protein